MNESNPTCNKRIARLRFSGPERLGDWTPDFSEPGYRRTPNRGVRRAESRGIGGTLSRFLYS
jgi:hypothetical protein